MEIEEDNKIERIRLATKKGKPITVLNIEPRNDSPCHILTKEFWDTSKANRYL
jgi:hypothetical protein